MVVGKVKCQDCSNMMFENPNNDDCPGLFPVPQCYIYEDDIVNPNKRIRCKYFCEKCIFCDYSGKEGDGVWKLRIFKIYRGTYGDKLGPICHNCLARALEGFHTGGGLIGSAIKKIKRVYKGNIQRIKRGN